MKQKKYFLFAALLAMVMGAAVMTCCSNDDQQFRNRMILRKAMLDHGFKPLDSEWWHFTLKDEPFPDTYFTFPVRELNR